MNINNKANFTSGDVLHIKKGFTLIELLAVIVILGIIATIATPIILGIISDSKEKTFKISLNNAKHAYELYIAQKELDPTFDSSKPVSIQALPLSSNLEGTIYKNDEGEIELKTATDGVYCASGTTDDLNMVKGSCEDLLKNILTVKVNANPSARNIVVTVDVIEGIPTSYSYKIEGPDNYSKTQTTTNNTYTFSDLKENTEYNITVVVKNKVGLTKEKRLTGRTKEGIKLELNPKEEYIKTGKVKITYSSIEEGQVNKYKWSNDSEFTTVTGNSVEVEAKNGTLIAVVSGNEETIISNQITINNIDNEGPTFTVVGNLNEVTITAIDDLSGLHEEAYSCDGVWQISNICKFSSDGNHTINARDKVLNNGTLITIQTPIITSEPAPSDTKGLKKIVYYNPTMGTSCYKSDAISTTGTKDGCMKWYVYKEDEKYYWMILDHNTTANVEYNKTTLKLDEYANNWSAEILEKRLITADEIANITGNPTFKSAELDRFNWFYFDSNSQIQTSTNEILSSYYWLFDYTKDCTSYGCKIGDSSNLGYWTSTPVFSDSQRAWYVDSSGGLYGTMSSTNIGIRPVIKILKV